MILGADLVHFVFALEGLVTLFIVAAIWIAVRDSRSARRFLYVVAIFYGIVTLHGIASAAGQLLAYGFHPFRASDVPPASRTAIVVLGSGSVTVGDWTGDNFSVVDRVSEERVFEAARVYRLIRSEYVVSSGGEPHPSRHREPSGQTMRAAMIELGIPAQRILLETDSRTTRDEALIVGRMLRPLPIDRIILVTSRSHMRRALGTFRAAGLDCVPAVAAEFDLGGLWVRQVVPTRDGLEASDAVVHEALGLVYYVLRGWWKP